MHLVWRLSIRIGYKNIGHLELILVPTIKWSYSVNKLGYYISVKSQICENPWYQVFFVTFIDKSKMNYVHKFNIKATDSTSFEFWCGVSLPTSNCVALWNSQKSGEPWKWPQWQICWNDLSTEWLPYWLRQHALNETQNSFNGGWLILSL